MDIGVVPKAKQIAAWREYAGGLFRKHHAGQARLREHKLKKEQEEYDRFMYKRLKEMARNCDNSVRELSEMDKQLFLRSKNCHLIDMSLFASARYLPHISLHHPISLCGLRDRQVLD